MTRDVYRPLAILALAATATAVYRPSKRLKSFDDWKRPVLDPFFKEWMDATLSANPIVMFTYGVSPFCSEALSVMRSTGCSFKTVELGKTWLMLGPKGAALRAELVRRTGQTSLPHLFVNGKSLGGLFTGGEDGFTGGDGIDAMIAAGTFEDLLYKSGARCTAPEDVPSALGGFEGRQVAAQQKEHVQGCDPTSKLGKALHNADPNDPTLRPPGTLRDARGNIVPALGALDRDAMGAPMADQEEAALAYAKMIQRMREATLRPPGDLILDAEGNSIRWAQGTGMRMGEEKDDASSMEEWARGTGMRIGEHPPAGVDPKSALGKALANADPNDKTLRPPGVLKDAAGNPVPMFGTGEESIRYETMEGPGTREAEYARMIARMRTSMLRPPGVLKAADGTPVPIFGAGGADVVGDALLYDAKKNPCGYDAREIARMRQAVLFPPGELLDAKGNAVPIYDGSPLPDPMDYESPSSYAKMIAQMRISTLRAPGDLKDADGKPVPIYGGWDLPDPMEFDNTVEYAKEIQRMRESTLKPPRDLMDANGNPVPIYGGWDLPDPMAYESPSAYAKMIQNMRDSTLRPPGELKDWDGNPVPIYGGGALPDPMGFDSASAYEKEIQKMRDSTLRPPGDLKDWDGNPVPIYGGWPLPEADTSQSALEYAKMVQKLRDSTLRPPGDLRDWDGNPVPIYGGWPLPDPMEFESTLDYAKEIQRMRDSTLKPPGDLTYWDGTPVPEYGGWPIPDPMNPEKAAQSAYAAQIERMRESTLKPPGVLKDAEGNPVPIYGGWPLPSPGSHPSAASYAAALGRMREETLMQPGDLMYWEGTPVPLYGGWPLPDPQNFDNAYTFAKQIQHIRDSTLAPAAKELLDVDGNPIPMYTGWPLPDASHFKDAKSYYEELKRMRQSTLAPGKNAPLYGGWPLPDPEGFSSPRAYAEEMARMHAEALKGASGNTDWDGNPVPVYQGWPLPDPATYSSTAKYAKEIQRMRDATLRPPGALQYWDGVEVPVYGGWPLPNPMEYESPEAYAAEIERMRYSTFLQAGELADWDGTKTPLYGGGYMNGPVEYNKAKMTPPEKVPAAVAAPHTSTLRDPSNLPEIDLSATVGEAKAAFSVADKKTAEATVEVSENVPGRVAEIVRKAAADAIAEKGSFTIAIAGGSLVKMLGAMAALDAEPSAGDEPDGGDSPGMFGGFVNKLKGFIGLGEGQSPIEWDKFHVAWVDERCVPHDSPDSNYGGAKDAWLDHVPIPRQQIYPINEAIVTDWSGGQSSMADQVASDYEHQLRLISESVLPRAGPRWDDDPQQTGHEGMPVFDLLLLGFGPDGHICSLFPGHDLLDDESERWILPISDSPKPPPERITFSMRAVNSAKKVVLVGTGDGKAGVVGTAFTPGTELPCTMIAGSPLWLIDAPAASTLPATVPRQCSDEWKRALSIAGPAQAYSSEASWYDEWEHRFQCWFMATPMRAGLSACFGALSLHLAQRFEAFTHGLSKGAAPHGAKSNAHAEAGCEWVSEEAGKLQLPEFPTLGDGMTFTLPPIPRLLPSWEHLQTLAPAEHLLATGERAFGEGAREYVQGSIAEAAVGGAAGLVLGMLLTFGVAYGVRKRARGMRMQVRRGSASRHKAATGAAQQQATVASADAFSA